MHFQKLYEVTLPIYFWLRSNYFNYRLVPTLAFLRTPTNSEFVPFI